MRCYIERRDGMIRIQQKVNPRLLDVQCFRTRRSLKDTPENYRDILPWADVMGHTIDERQSE